MCVCRRHVYSLHLEKKLQLLSSRFVIYLALVQLVKRIDWHVSVDIRQVSTEDPVIYYNLWKC